MACKYQPQPTVTDDGVHHILDQGGILLTSSAHLARNLRQHFDRARRKQQSVWSSPEILPWARWIENLWDSMMLSGQIPPLRLLSSLHEKKLWQQIVVENLPSDLVFPEALARQAQEAWKLWLDHEQPPEENGFSQKMVSRSFFVWAQKFVEKCRAYGWVTLAELPWKLSHPSETGSLPISGPVVLTGFDKLTPAQECLIGFLQEKGVSVIQYESTPRPARIMVQPCSGPEEESRLAASWALGQLKGSTERRLGIIVPDLESRKNSLKRSLDEILFPQSRLSMTIMDGICPYRFSTRESLASSPMIRDAILILECQFQEVSLGSLTSILLSPYLPGWSEEYDDRSGLALLLREGGAQQIKPRQLIAMLREQASCPLLLKFLQTILTYQIGFSDSLLVQQWVQRFISLLQEVGWGQGRALDARELHLLDAWKQLLNTFSAMQEIWGKLTLETALSYLWDMAAETGFQTEQNDVPIEILDIHDCAGLRFDAIWLLGWHDGVWPDKCYRNPLISAAAQKKWGVSSASAELAREHAIVITRNILSCVSEIQIGLPQADGDQRLQPSPLLPGISDKAYSCTQDIEALPRLYSQVKTSSIEIFTEDPIPFQKGKKVHGGSAILKTQSACPFQAFARFRLHAKPPEPTHVGPRDRLYGSLLHAVLEQFWGLVGHRDGLEELGQLELENRVEVIIESVLHRQLQEAGERFSESWIGMIKARLKELVLSWLDLERRRDDFVVMERESSYVTDIGGLKLRIKIDRIDRIRNSQDLLLIDYKTGRVSPAEWFSDRPDDPQLPLYYKALQQQGRTVKGLALGLVRKDGVALLGLAADEGFPDKISPFHKHKLGRQYQSWEQMLQDWDKVLEDLAQDFIRGEATPNPKRFPETCRFCRMQTLCRIDELRKTS